MMALPRLLAGAGGFCVCVCVLIHRKQGGKVYFVRKIRLS